MMVDAKEMARIFRAASKGAHPMYGCGERGVLMSNGTEYADGVRLSNVFAAIASIYEKTDAATTKVGE